MYIVKETDEMRINKATELAGERSKKLADNIRDILALRGKDELSVEIIEEAIDIADGKKKPTDLIPCQPVRDVTHVRPRDKFLTDFMTWFVPAHEETGWISIDVLINELKEINWISTHELKETSCVFAKEYIHVVTSESKISPYQIRGRKTQNFAWDYFLEGIKVNTDVILDNLSRGMLFARSR